MTGGTSPEGGGRLDKPLGRGLEDISHLFQLGRRGEATANEHPSGGSTHHPAASSPAGAASAFVTEKQTEPVLLTVLSRKV